MNKKVYLLIVLILSLLIDLLAYQSIYELFGPPPFLISIEFSNRILQSQELITTILILFIFKNIALFLYGIVTRNYWMLLFCIAGISLLYFQILQIQNMALSDVGVILTYLEGLSDRTSEEALWGQFVTNTQIQSFVVWLVIGVAVNLNHLIINYLIARDIYRGFEGTPRNCKITTGIRLIAAISYALSFLLALLEFAKYSIYIHIVISLTNMLIIILDLTYSYFKTKGSEHPLIDSYKARTPLTLIQMKYITIILFGGFILLFGLPWFYAIIRYASLQFGIFGEWSFYLWPAIIIIVLYILLIIMKPSVILIKTFRLISKIAFIFAAFNMILNISDTQYVAVWLYIISIGHYLIGGVHLSDGYYTIPHFYGFLWIIVILNSLNIIFTRDAKFTFKFKELREKFEALKKTFSTIKHKANRKIPNKPERIRNIRAETFVMLFLILSLAAFIASIDNYGQDIILKKHPTVNTRLNFWSSGTYIPPEYLEIIKSHNLKYNTTTTLYCFGNEYINKEDGKFLIDIPEAKYPFRYPNRTYFYLNATETLDYMQSLIDARIEFYQAVSGMETIYPALYVLNSTTINATFRERFNLIFKGFIFDIESGGNYGSFNRSRNEEKQMYKANVVRYVHDSGKKIGYTTVSYTIGDWLDGDNDVSTLYRIFDFYPSSLNPAFRDFYYDKYNWMIYRTDQPGRNLNPYFSYLHFKEAKSYMQKIQNRYPELNIDSDTNFGISIGWTTPDRNDQFSHPTEGPKNILLEAQIANSLGISEVVLFSLLTFLKYFSAEQYAWILEELNKDWVVKIEFDRVHGLLGPPFATLWDLPNFTGTRFIYHLIDFWLNPWFGIYVCIIIITDLFAAALYIFISSKKCRSDVNMCKKR